MGTPTVVIDEFTVFGNKLVRRGKITFSNSYATATGEAVTPAQLGVTTLHLLLYDYVKSGLMVSWIYTDSLFRIQNPMPAHAHSLVSIGSQGAGTALQALTSVLGTTAAGNITMAGGGATNIQNVAAALGSEVPNATDLSAIVIRFLAIGQ